MNIIFFKYKIIALFTKNKDSLTKVNKAANPSTDVFTYPVAVSQKASFLSQKALMQIFTKTLKEA